VDGIEHFGKFLDPATLHLPTRTARSTRGCRPISKEELRSLLLAHWVPKRFLDADTALLDPMISQAMADARADGSFLMLGPTGRGKSYAAACWLRGIAERDAEWHQDRYTTKDFGGENLYVAKGSPYWRADVLWVTVSPWLHGLKQSFGENARDGDDTVLTVDRVARAYAVVLDDLGAERSTDWAVETLYNVVAEREAMMLPTVVTTNLGLSELQAWNPRLASRLSGFTMLLFKGPDRRLPHA